MSNSPTNLPTTSISAEQWAALEAHCKRLEEEAIVVQAEKAAAQAELADKKRRFSEAQATQEALKAEQKRLRAALIAALWIQ
jgi:chromosome segregation ATPase